MARIQIRSKVGVVISTLGLAVLLAGPTSTFGVGVPTVDSATTQVTGTVQGAVQTTQQTAATTVQQVESTVQPAVQTTQQVAAAVPAAPAPATTQTVTRASAPVKKQATAVTRTPAPAKRVTTTVAATTQRAATTTATAPAGVTKRAATRKITRTQRVSSTPTRSRASEDPAPQCDIPLLALVPGGDQIRALLAVACDAAGGLDLGARLGLTPHVDTTGPASAGTDAVSTTSDPSAFRRVRAAAASTHATTGAGTPAANAANASQSGRAIAPLGSPVVGRGVGLAHIGAVDAAHVSAASSDSIRGSADTRHHHTWFSGQSRGAEILLAIIFANLAILGGIALWRLAVRWVIPRFA